MIEIAVMALLGILLVFVLLLVVGGKPKRRRRNMANPANQMDAISKAEFERVPLLNKSEYRVFAVLEETCRAMNGRYRVMAQTSLGELIRPKGQGEAQREAFASINSKRLDFAIVDARGHLALAVEYQGGGHYQGRAFMRDAVKREALRKAGVVMLEVPKDMGRADVRAAVEKALGAG